MRFIRFFYLFVLIRFLKTMVALSIAEETVLLGSLVK